MKVFDGFSARIFMHEFLSHVEYFLHASFSEYFLAYHFFGIVFTMSIFVGDDAFSGLDFLKQDDSFRGFNLLIKCSSTTPDTAIPEYVHFTGLLPLRCYRARLLLSGAATGHAGQTTA